MAVTKRLQRYGKLRCFTFTQELITHLGFKPDELDKAYVRVELIDGALVITREDALAKSLQELSATLVEVERRRRDTVVLRSDATVKLTGPRLKLCQLFWEEGPMRPVTVVAKLGVSSEATYTQLTRARQEGLLVKNGVVYSLNPEYFDV